MKRIKPDKDLKKAMDNYYNNSQGYLYHLNRKRDGSFDNYTYFLNKYVKKLKPNSTVVEIGCGDGYATYLLAKKYPNVNFIGSDISEKFINYAKKNFNAKNLAYKLEDSLNFSFEDEKVDMIVSMEVIEHVPNIPRLIDESLRILKKNGLLVIVTVNHFSPISVLLDIIKFKKRPPFAHTYLSQYKLLFYNIFMSIKKIIKPSFVYVQPDLSSNSDDGGDFDAVYLANAAEIVNYLKKRKAMLLNIGFQGPSLSSKIIGKFLPQLSRGIGIVAKKN